MPFDRGWVKNVGFCLAGAGPADSVYFHDVDTLPVCPTWVYPPVPRGHVVHLYGHTHCLGGIVGVDPAVFWALRGFGHSPNWGGEDRQLQTACMAAHVPIQRPAFCARFETKRVVELNEQGRPDPTASIQAQLLYKVQNTALRTAPPPGALHTIQYAIVAQLATTGPRVRHYIVEKK